MRSVTGKVRPNTAESANLCMRGNPKRENREVLLASFLMELAPSEERSENVSDGKSDMNANRNSDESIVPAKLANNDVAEASTESAEERGSTKRNDVHATLPRTSRMSASQADCTACVKPPRKDSQLKFTALLHHIDCERLHEAFFDLKKGAAVGTDGVHRKKVSGTKK